MHAISMREECKGRVSAFDAFITWSQYNGHLQSGDKTSSFHSSARQTRRSVVRTDQVSGSVCRDLDSTGTVRIRLAQ